MGFGILVFHSADHNLIKDPCQHKLGSLAHNLMLAQENDQQWPMCFSIPRPTSPRHKLHKNDLQQILKIHFNITEITIL